MFSKNEAAEDEEPGIWSSAMLPLQSPEKGLQRELGGPQRDMGGPREKLRDFGGIWKGL